MRWSPCARSGRKQNRCARRAAPTGGRAFPGGAGSSSSWTCPRRPHLDVTRHLGVGARHKGSSPRYRIRGMEPCSSRIADVLADSRFRPEAEAGRRPGRPSGHMERASCLRREPALGVAPDGTDTSKRISSRQRSVRGSCCGTGDQGSCGAARIHPGRKPGRRAMMGR